MNRIWMNPATDTPELRALVRQRHPDAKIMGRPFASELTEVGEQLLIPGCEAKARHRVNPRASLTYGARLGDKTGHDP